MNVVLLWHMHQPDYVDRQNGKARTPWVRLHAVHSYLDMIEMVERFPTLKVAFNFTPVLVEQLVEIGAGEVIDDCEAWSRIQSENLTQGEKEKILEHFFRANFDTLIRPLPRFWELLNQRGRIVDFQNLAEVTNLFSAQDYRDLQTLYNLAWCGFAAYQTYPLLQELRAQGRDFTEDQKSQLLDLHREIVRTVLSRYRAAIERGQIEMTTSPYCHPILPLLLDTNLARRSMPHVNLPPQFSAPEDVRSHLALAQEMMREVFGAPARGLWPSEGSVAPELIPFFRDAGFDYFFTDEAILFRSFELDPHWRGRGVDHMVLFQGWRVSWGGATVSALFRERPLSDFVGFQASQNPPDQAANFLLHHFENICQVATSEEAAILIALDGENAWEAFPDGGERFLSSLYQGLTTHSRLRTVRPGDYFDAYRPKVELGALHTGSWINADFDIWIGDSEENRAWEWLGRTRQFLRRIGEDRILPAEKVAAAMRSLYAAEGSDWFWWYGPDFSTDSDLLFDEIFRTHLRNVYLALGFSPPPYLDFPICAPAAPTPYTIPRLYLHPQLTGRLENFFDWVGAGTLDALVQQTAMFQANRLGQKLYFGFDEEHFYLRLDLAGAPEEVEVEFLSPHIRRVIASVLPNGSWKVRTEHSDDAVLFSVADERGAAAWEDFFVLMVPVGALGWQEKDPVSFFVRLLRERLALERYPERGTIDFCFPSKDFEARQWFV
ncbi:glycoside hydrolase family 57 protein [Verrucomicrobium sp. 3C]|uniref:glycoside hydrolase family 57 protein n=1 Tax=Verrucomicrobium sp. 3C TaxID=1134055 RepID=UPI00037AF987|nr:glycoside hydrolase family 57 protein [Verrucomicrobium sp. 3C]